MHWIALQWLPEEEDADLAMPTPEALGWWALNYTPHVCWQDEALMLEVSACERLWGGRSQLMRQILHETPAPDARLLGAQGPTSLEALARLRRKLRAQQQGAPALPVVEAAPDNVVRIDAWKKTGSTHALDRVAVAS